MRLSGGIEVIRTSTFGAIAEPVFILFSIIYMKIAKTKTSFLEVLNKSLNNSLFGYNYNI